MTAITKPNQTMKFPPLWMVTVGSIILYVPLRMIAHMSEGSELKLFLTFMQLGYVTFAVCFVGTVMWADPTFPHYRDEMPWPWRLLGLGYGLPLGCVLFFISGHANDTVQGVTESVVAAVIVSGHIMAHRAHKVLRSDSA